MGQNILLRERRHACSSPLSSPPVLRGDSRRHRETTEARRGGALMLRRLTATDEDRAAVEAEAEAARPSFSGGDANLDSARQVAALYISSVGEDPINTSINAQERSIPLLTEEGRAEDEDTTRDKAQTGTQREYREADEHEDWERNVVGSVSE
ncbi:hypothetical protein NHX12_021314 [Muraenolepis orangiensis]|uniref:Uncharacterized protein n=1 Tax=Muraenolepis orangiensis TaxID=630683 RepID=A0A9Q0ETB9_9TELE|nr:hypothetical protein NHX12_021314 [Muraenolepis orangiensis]